MTFAQSDPKMCLLIVILRCCCRSFWGEEHCCPALNPTQHELLNADQGKIIHVGEKYLLLCFSKLKKCVVVEKHQYLVLIAFERWR